MKPSTTRFRQNANSLPSDGAESGEMCSHPADAVHPEGEFISATIQVETMLLAQYAVAHYLEQDHVLDADVSGDTESVLGRMIPHVS